MRLGYSVGRNTTEASLTDQLKRYKLKSLTKQENEEEKKAIASLFPNYYNSAKYGEGKAGINPAHVSLKEKCLRIVAENFEKMPIRDIIPPSIMNDIVDRLPLSLSPIIGARYIYNENYWKKACVEKYGWHNCRLIEHGFLWKQTYFEKYLTERLEQFDDQVDDFDSLYELVDASMDYIFTLSFKQLPSHMDISDICSSLPNLTKIDFTYGIKNIGMNYERILFGMKISDATSLAKVFDRVDTLTTIALSGNMIDDDLLRMLMTGLIKNSTIAHIDLSHNKITNHGARLLSKLLGENSVITTLNLADNQIHAEGGRYFARGLRENDSLQYLNLRLNRLTDEGCTLLLEGLQDNISLTDLNIASNSAGTTSGRVLLGLLRDQDHHINSLDISGNNYDAEFFNLMRLALANNKHLRRVDMRKNPGYSEGKLRVTIA